MQKMIVLSAKSFIPFFLMYVHFFVSCYCISQDFQHDVESSGEKGLPFLVPDLNGKALSFSPLCMMQAVRILFIRKLKKFPIQRKVCVCAFVCAYVDMHIFKSVINCHNKKGVRSDQREKSGGEKNYRKFKMSLCTSHLSRATTQLVQSDGPSP